MKPMMCSEWLIPFLGITCFFFPALTDKFHIRNTLFKSKLVRQYSNTCTDEFLLNILLEEVVIVEQRGWY